MTKDAQIALIGTSMALCVLVWTCTFVVNALQRYRARKILQTVALWRAAGIDFSGRYLRRLIRANKGVVLFANNVVEYYD